MPPVRGRGKGRKHQPPRRTHNLGGCSTCRRRHVKCDRTRPQCTTCSNAGLTCEGFPSQIRWASMSYPPTKPSGARETGPSPQPVQAPVDGGFNAPLTQDPPQPAADIFATHRTEYSYATHEPASFHANQLAHMGNFNDVMIDPSTPDAGAVEDNADFVANDADIFSHPSASSFSDFESLFDTPNGLVWNDLFDSASSLSAPMIQHQPYGDPLSLHPQGVNQPQEGLSLPHLYGHALMQDEPYSRQNMGSIAAVLDSQPPPYTPKEMDELEVLDHAKVLLKQFRDFVIPQFSPVPMNNKSPWEINNWNAAVRTHADMTYLVSHDVKHANKANLFAILGCSAHSITKALLCVDNISPEKGTQILEFVSKRAKKHMQESLKLETSGSQKAKYKDQLMAIFSLIALATLSGNPTDARCYLIDAERLLRLRGLAKQQVSRRARLLHHVYTWLRIIGESTFILHDHSRSGLQARIEKTFKSNRETFSVSPTNEQDNTTEIEHSQLDDFLRIKSSGEDSECDSKATKEQEVGLRDIHLEDMRNFPNTLYMDIYGIPEKWLSLVSQTTRVANIMDYLESTSARAPRAFAASLQRKTARLEHMVCSFSAQYTNSRSTSPSPSRGGSPTGGKTCPKSSKACRAMLRALGSALVILFYRRIRKVHPCILQGHVNDVINALKDFDLAQDADNNKTPGTPWPAFIAGCEALSSASQDWLMNWMRRGALLSASNGFLSSEQVMREVWERREAIAKGSKSWGPKGGDYDKGSVYSWVDVLKEGRFWPMLY